MAETRKFGFALMISIPAKHSVRVTYENKESATRKHLESPFYCHTQLFIDDFDKETVVVGIILLGFLPGKLLVPCA